MVVISLKFLFFCAKATIEVWYRIEILILKKFENIHPNTRMLMDIFALRHLMTPYIRNFSNIAYREEGKAKKSTKFSIYSLSSLRFEKTKCVFEFFYYEI